MLRVRVGHHGATDGGAHHVRGQRNPGGTAGEQHGLEVLHGDASGLHSPLQRVDGLAHDGAHHVLELGARDAHLRLHIGQQHGHGGIAVRRQGLLGEDTLLAQTGERRTRGRVVGVQGGHGVADHLAHVGEHRFVEVDTAQPLDALRPAEQFETGGHLAQHGRVERAAAEVVHRDGLARLHALARRVLQGGSDRFRDVHGLADAGGLHGLAEEIDLVLTPVGRVGDGDEVGRAALAHTDVGEDLPQHQAEQTVGGERRAVEHDGCGVAQPALELTGEASRFVGTSALRGVADEHRVVLTEEDHGGDGGGMVPQRDHLRPAIAHHRRGSERGAEIDPQYVTHNVLPE